MESRAPASQVISFEYVLSNFKYECILSHDSRTKLLYVLGKVDDHKCILSFEQCQYADDDIPELASQAKELTGKQVNDVYAWFEAKIQTVSPNTRIKIIFPATRSHIRKYEHQERVLIMETPEMYKQVTHPYIASLPEDRTQWVYNILDGHSEADRVLWRDDDTRDGFVILPDMKWDGSKKSLYWVAIANNPNIISLRLLTVDHLDLLYNIRRKAKELAKEKFGLMEDQLRLFVHYQPTYYHFHVHITAISFSDALGIVVGQAHLLDTIIYHLEAYPDYYSNALLPFVIGKGHLLYTRHQEWLASHESTRQPPKVPFHDPAK